MNRRAFLKLTGVAAASALLGKIPALAAAGGKLGRRRKTAAEVHGGKEMMEGRMKQLQKKLALLVLGGIMMASTVAAAHPIRTPEGNMPMVHWAVVESTPGDMAKMGEVAAR
ncbi:MAG: hypothetical protein J6Z82_03820, partial [Schwartzia sp.]|nr:hypothetical protein [Schwartzia sp. (in: firmicutes)]